MGGPFPGGAAGVGPWIQQLAVAAGESSYYVILTYCFTYLCEICDICDKDVPCPLFLFVAKFAQK